MMMRDSSVIVHVVYFHFSKKLAYYWYVIVALPLIQVRRKSMRVVLLMGSGDGEAPISLRSGAVFREALLSLGHEVVDLIFDSHFIDRIRAMKPDVVFNAMHGKYGEDGVIQAILDFFRIPYTHSGPLASTIGMNKDVYKQICRGLGIPVADGCVLRADQISNDEIFQIMRERNWPRAVLKPVNSGSSLGVNLLDINVQDVVIDVLQHIDRFLLEEYISGREFCVCILGREVIGSPVEIKSSKPFLNYEVKYTAGLTSHDMHPIIDAELQQSMCDYALEAYKVTHCTGMARADFLCRDVVIGDEQPLVMLEINTHPGFTEVSILPDVALQHGLSLQQVVQVILDEVNYNKRF